MSLVLSSMFLVMSLMSFHFNVGYIFYGCVLLFCIFMMGDLGCMEGCISISEGFYYDVMSWGLILMSFWVFYLVFMIQKKEFGVFLMGVLSMILFFFFSVDSLFMLYFYFECALIPMFWFIFFEGKQLERIKASMYMLMYTILGSLPFIVLVLLDSFLFDYSFGCVDFIGLHKKMGSFLELILVFCFLVKLPMFGVHYWLPKAHVEAPVVGSMILAAVLLKMGGFGLFRVLMFFSCFNLDYFLISVSLYGAIFLSLYSFYQVDMKVLIAYSSVVHMGLMMGGIFSSSVWGAWGSLMMMLGHGFCSSALFCMINCMYERYYTRNILMLKGLMSIFPSFTFFWFIFCIINMAVPPFLSFFSEVLLMGSIIKWSSISILMLVLISFLSAAYSLYFFSVTQHGKSCFSWSVYSPFDLEFYMCFLHLLPLILFIFKPEMFFFLMLFK